MSEVVLKSNIRWLQLFKVTISLMFLAPIFIVFLKEKFSIADAVLLQTVFSFSVGIFEVPAGVFADIYGKKLSLIVGALILSITIFIYGIIDNFTNFLVAEVILGLGYSLLSGTDTALLYETMLTLGQESEFKKVYGKIKQQMFYSIAIASIIGSVIAKWGFEWTFYATSLSSFVAIFFALKIKEPKVKKAKNKNHIAKATKELRYVVILSVTIAMFNQSLFNLYQPYFSLSGVDIVWFGAIMASFQIVAAISSRFAHAIERKFGFLELMWLMFAISILAMFLLGNFVYMFSFVFIYLQQFVRGVREVVVDDFINKHVSSQYRTTANSLESLLYKVSYSPFMVLIAYLTDNYELAKTINIVGMIATMFFVIAVFGRFISLKRREYVCTKS